VGKLPIGAEPSLKFIKEDMDFPEELSSRSQIVLKNLGANPIAHRSKIRNNIYFK
jgi:hypothetical protein